MAISGCSYRLASLDSQHDTEPTTTGAISAVPQPGRHPAPTYVSSSGAEMDLAYARAAASDVLARAGKDSSVPWQNPQTGAGGNITPLATSYNEGGRRCRDFLASYVHGGSQDWLRGAACRTAAGDWEVQRLKPLNSG